MKREGPTERIPSSSNQVPIDQFPNLFIYAKPQIYMLNKTFNVSHVKYSTSTLFRKRCWRLVWLW